MIPIWLVTASPCAPPPPPHDVSATRVPPPHGQKPARFAERADPIRSERSALDRRREPWRRLSHTGRNAPLARASGDEKARTEPRARSQRSSARDLHPAPDMLQAIAKVEEECAPALTASQVRMHVLADHTLLRVQMERVETLARGGSFSYLWPRLQAASTILLTFVRIHFTRADEILVPLLRSIGGWGPSTAARIRAERLERSAEMDRLFRQVSSSHAVPDRTHEALLSLCAWLRRDLEEAERILMHPDVEALGERAAEEPMKVAAGPKKKSTGRRISVLELLAAPVSQPSFDSATPSDPWCGSTGSPRSAATTAPRISPAGSA